MCTLSWQLNGTSLEILFNRDEKLSRPAALPPDTLTLNGVRVLAPLDPKGGGTWLATNEHGLTLCLLNNYLHQPPTAPANARSRGQLVRELASVSNPGIVGRRLSEIAPEQYQPFFLIAFEERSFPRQWHWDGHSIRETGMPGCPVSTSSLYPRLVPRLRRYYYRLATRNGFRTLTPAQLLDFHSSRRPWPPAFSVAMARRDRGTVSLTRVRIGPSETIMDYWHGDPAIDPLRASPCALQRH